ADGARRPPPGGTAPGRCPARAGRARGGAPGRRVPDERAADGRTPDRPAAAGSPWCYPAPARWGRDGSAWGSKDPGHRATAELADDSRARGGPAWVPGHRIAGCRGTAPVDLVSDRDAS